jgi:hypothetical protein
VDVKELFKSKKEFKMATNEQTSAKVGKIASRVLRNPKSSKDSKSIAGSVLTQRPDRKKGGKKKGG